MRLLATAFFSALVLAACSMPSPGPYRGPVPIDGPLLFTCEDGTQLTVEFANGEARVAIIGGRAFTLPALGADYYSNGRYAIRGQGDHALWEVGRSAPVSCTGR